MPDTPATFQERIAWTLTDVSGYAALSTVQADAILAMPEMELIRTILSRVTLRFGQTEVLVPEWLETWVGSPR